MVARCSHGVEVSRGGKKVLRVRENCSDQEVKWWLHVIQEATGEEAQVIRNPEGFGAPENYTVADALTS